MGKESRGKESRIGRMVSPPCFLDFLRKKTKPKQTDKKEEEKLNLFFLHLLFHLSFSQETTEREAVTNEPQQFAFDPVGSVINPDYDPHGVKGFIFGFPPEPAPAVGPAAIPAAARIRSA